MEVKGPRDLSPVLHLCTPIIKVAFDLCSAMCFLYYDGSAMEPKNLESVPRGHILFYKARCSEVVFFWGGGICFLFYKQGSCSPDWH